MDFLKQIENWLTTWAGSVPLEIFVFVGGLVEEIVAPIPSPLVAATAGTLASAQGRGLSYLLYIALIASFSKTLGALLFYFVADKAEDLILKRFGKFIGFSHKEVESIGKHFNNTRKDDFVLVILRAIPIMPSTPISIVCGFIKLNLRTFIQSTFIGFFVRNLTFLYIGYVGFSTYQELLQGFDSLESFITLVIAAILVLVLAIGYYKRGKGNLMEWLKEKFKF